MSDEELGETIKKKARFARSETYQASTVPTEPIEAAGITVITRAELLPTNEAPQEEAAADIPITITEDEVREYYAAQERAGQGGCDCAEDE